MIGLYNRRKSLQEKIPFGSSQESVIFPIQLIRFLLCFNIKCINEANTNSYKYKTTNPMLDTCLDPHIHLRSLPKFRSHNNLLINLKILWGLYRVGIIMIPLLKSEKLGHKSVRSPTDMGTQADQLESQPPYLVHMFAFHLLKYFDSTDWYTFLCIFKLNKLQ